MLTATLIRPEQVTFEITEPTDFINFDHCLATYFSFGFKTVIAYDNVRVMSNGTHTLILTRYSDYDFDDEVYEIA